MARARAFSHQPNPAMARLRDEARANVDDLERRVKALEVRATRLELLATWVRGALYSAIVVAFALIPAPAPEEPPE